MRNKRLKKKYTPIDKSKLAISCRKPVRDTAYRKSFRGNSCEASRNGIDLCGETSVDTVVGAHIRTGECSGFGNKPSDDLVIPLCYECHCHEGSGGLEWYLENIVKPQARRRYREWLQQKK